MDDIPTPQEPATHPQGQQHMIVVAVIIVAVVVAVSLYVSLYSGGGVYKDSPTGITTQKTKENIAALTCSLAQKAAFVGTESTTGATDIYLACLESGEHVKLTDGTMEVGSPSLSPDGTKVLFHGRTDARDDFDIYLYDTNTFKVEQLTSDPGEDMFPAYSPNGTVIAFSSDRRGVASIYLLNLLDGEEKLYKLTGTLDTEPHFSMSGTRVVFTSYDYDTENNPQIYTINIDRSGRTALTTEGSNQFPRFSPSGQHIAFISERSTNSGEGTGDPYLMNADGTDEHPLFVSSTNESFPSFTPNGTSIDFTLGASDSSYAAIYRSGVIDSLPEKLLEIDGLLISNLVYPMARGVH